MTKLGPIGILAVVFFGAAAGTAVFRDLASPESLNDGLAVLITLNAVASGLTYALIGKASVLKGRTEEGAAFGFAVSAMVSCSIGGALLGVVHIAWNPGWSWFLPIASGLLVSAPALIPMLAIQEQRSRHAEAESASEEATSQHPKLEVPLSVEPISDGPGLLRIRPKEFIAEPSDPFKNDVLGREEQVKAFCSILANIETPAVVSVDARWGTGKTAFMKMCSAWIRSAYFASQNVAVAEFNAWKEGYTRSAIKDIVAAVTNQIPGADDAQQRIAEIQRRELIKLASGGLVTDEVFEIGEGPNAQVERFQGHLRAFANAGGGRLVVFVDELDRCPPDYAMEILECLRHLFDTEGVLVVLAVNQQALNEAVQSLHGLEEEAGRYSRKFVDQTIWLPVPDEPTTKEFLRHLWTETGLADRFGDRDYTNLIFETLLQRSDRSLRTLEQTAYRVATAFASIPPEIGSALPVWEQAMTGLVVLRETDREMYTAFSNGTQDVLDVAQSLYKRFPETNQIVLERLERALLSTRRNAVEMMRHHDIRERYHASGHGERFEQLRNQHEQSPFLFSPELPKLDFLLSAIEMIEHPTEQ